MKKHVKINAEEKIQKIQKNTHFLKDIFGFSFHDTKHLCMTLHSERENKKRSKNRKRRIERESDGTC